MSRDRGCSGLYGRQKVEIEVRPWHGGCWGGKEEEMWPLKRKRSYNILFYVDDSFEVSVRAFSEEDAKERLSRSLRGIFLNLGEEYPEWGIIACSSKYKPHNKFRKILEDLKEDQ